MKHRLIQLIAELLQEDAQRLGGDIEIHQEEVEIADNFSKIIDNIVVEKDEMTISLKDGRLYKATFTEV